MSMVSQPSPQAEAGWRRVMRLLRWDKPEGRLILMIPALWAVFLAAEYTSEPLPPWPLVGVIILGSLTTSAAGCVINDLWDRNIDPQVERTKQRPLAARALSVKTGIGVAIAAFICAWGLSLYLNRLSFWLCVAAVPVIVLYPLAKRVFPVPQLVLSIAWGFAVLISWTAVTASLQPATGWLWAATVLWTLGFDTVYAIPDRDYDRQVGVNSSALFFGDHTPVAVAVFYVAAAACLARLGVVMALSLGYWVSWAIAVGLWGLQSWQLGRRSPTMAECGRYFRQNVYIGIILLVGMILGMLL